GERSNTVKHVHGLEDGGIDADTDTGIAGFDAPKCRARRECAAGNHIRWQAAAQPRLAQVGPQFLERTANRDRGQMRSGHWKHRFPLCALCVIRCFHKRKFMDSRHAGGPPSRDLASIGEQTIKRPSSLARSLWGFEPDREFLLMISSLS